MLGCRLLEVMHRDAAWQLGRHLLQQAPAASRRTGQHGGAARAILGPSRGLKPTALSLQIPKAARPTTLPLISY